jgi:glycosyltransferase involved in cell wall biosynthesis
MPRVSIIIPAYNAAAFLPDALESVLRQTYQDWEVILVDDGSTDNSRAVVESFLPGFQGKLHYLYQSNQGQSAARNLGIRNSSGEFIALLDADDAWLEQRLELGVAVLDSDPNAGLVHGKVARINEAGEFIEYPPSPPRKYLEGRIAGAIYTRRAHLLCPTILFRRACVDAVGVFDEPMRATEDRDLCFRIAERYDVRYINEVVSNYRISANSASRDPERVWKWQTYFIEKHRLRGSCSRMAARHAVANLHREAGDVLFGKGEVRESLRRYFKAAVCYPLSLVNIYMLLRAAGEPVLAWLRAPARPSSGSAL